MRSDPYWKTQYEALKQRGKHANAAIVTVARKLLVAIWHVLTKRQAYRHATPTDLAYKMVAWSRQMNAEALRGLTRRQFVKYGLSRLGVGQHLTRIVKNGTPRGIAPAEEVRALKPELRPPD